MEHDPGNKRADRPYMPEGYGLAPLSDASELIPWEAIQEKLRAARNYWVCSTRTDGRPHAMPVWGVWLDAAFYFSTDPLSRKGRNLTANPEVVVHLESGDDVVILEGKIGMLAGETDVTALDEAYFSKYKFHISGGEAPAGAIYVLRPRVVLTWFESTFPTSATRYTFKDA